MTAPLSRLAGLLAQATPGPWKVVPSRLHGTDVGWPMIVTVDDDPRTTTSVCEFGFDRSDENAALIVLAPALAADRIVCEAALREIEEYFAAEYREGDKPFQAVIASRAALALLSRLNEETA